MAMTTKRYTRQFKAYAVQFARESDKPIAEVARELGVRYQTLYDWMWKAGVVGNAPEKRRRASMAPSAAEVELRRVQRELDEVKEENELLKKWAAFSTKKTSN